MFNRVAEIFEEARLARQKNPFGYSRSGVGVNPIQQKKGMSLRISLRKNTRDKTSIKGGDRVQLVFDQDTERLAVVKNTFGYFGLTKGAALQIPLLPSLLIEYPFLRKLEACNTYDGTDVQLKKDCVEFGVFKVPAQGDFEGLSPLRNRSGDGARIQTNVVPH